MRYLLAADADVQFIATLCRPVAPIDDIRTLLRLVRELRELRPAIVHTHMAKAGLLGRLAATIYNLTRGHAPRARIVHTYHGHVLEGYFSAPATFVFVSLERLLARASDALIAISPAIRGDLVDALRIGTAAQYRVIPLGFDLARFAAIGNEARAEARRRLDIAPGAPVITTVGRLTAIKQHGLFVDVVAQLSATRPDLVALIAGDGELRGELEAQIRARGLQGHIRLLGWRRDLEDIYAATDVFLLTSRNEGTPVALIEAMASAVPGVSTDVGGVKDVITSSEVGVRAPFGDVDALTAAAARLLADHQGRRAMGERARARVLHQYSLDRLVDDLATLYDELLYAR